MLIEDVEVEGGDIIATLGGQSRVLLSNMPHDSNTLKEFMRCTNFISFSYDRAHDTVIVEYDDSSDSQKATEPKWRWCKTFKGRDKKYVLLVGTMSYIHPAL